MDPFMTKTELLSPCGEYECFLAAVNAGADAVYLGGDFSARAYAKNFTGEEIINAINHAHLHGKKVYLTLNILLKEAEIDTVADYLTPFYEAGLDGVIVQDPGVIRVLRHCFPDLHVHASTQMTVTDTEGVRLLTDAGASRVVLARELSLDEISRIHDETNAELECFIHGALCYSYSGKCLMSSLIGGRSGNRGRCAQPCRLPYNGSYLLSCRDICTLEILPMLIEAGITSFKIEGRMKGPEYVAGVTGIYRKYMDLYLKDRSKPYKVDPEDLYLLKTLYTRSGHTQGYYQQHNGRSMITIDKPGYAKADEHLAKSAYARFCKDETFLQADLTVTLKQGQKAKLEISCGGKKNTVYGDPVEAAKNRALGVEDIKKQLTKTGGTGFEAGSIKIELDGSVFMPVSSLNALRREGLNTMKRSLLSDGRRTVSVEDSPSQQYRFLKETFSRHNAEYRTIPSIHVSVTTKEQALEASTLKDTEILSVPAGVFLNDHEFLSELGAITGNVKLFVILPYICRNRYFQRNQTFLETLLRRQEISGVMIRNYESLYYLKSIGYSGEVLADLHLYAYNRFAHAALTDLGATVTTVPVELNRKELKMRGIFDEDLIVYGRLPLMISAQCVRKTCGHCDHENGTVLLSDRYHVIFPAKSGCDECCSIIYNSVPLSLHADSDLISEIHPRSVRMIFTDEDAALIPSIVRDLKAALFENQPFDPSYPYTRGHLLRGVE